MDAKIKDYKRQQEIDIASAAGDAEKIYQISRTYREKEISDVQAQIKMLRSANLTRSGLTDEQKKQLEGLNEKYLDLLKEQEIAEINHTNAISAERKKQLDDYNNFIGGVNERYKKSTLTGREFELEQAKEQYRQDVKRLNDTSSANQNYQRDLLKVTELFKLQEKEINKKFDQQEAEERKRKRSEREKKQQEENKTKQDAEKKYQDFLISAQNERLNNEEEIAEAIFQASLSAQEKEIQAIRDAYFEKIELANQYGLDSSALTEAQKAAEAEINKKYADAEAAAKQKAADEEKARQDKANAEQIKAAELRLKVANDVFNGLIQLNDAFASKDSARARRSFQISKTLGMAQATMNTWAAANAILKDPTYVGPTRFFAVAAAITAGLANVAKIAKTQFQESSSPSGGSGGGGGSTPSMTQVGGGGGGSTPSFNPLNTSFLQNQQGQQPPLQAFVLSTQVNSTVEAQQRIREQTTL